MLSDRYGELAVRIGVVMSGCRPGGGGELLTLRTIEVLVNAGHSVVLRVPGAVDLAAYSRFYNDSFTCKIAIKKSRVVEALPLNYRTIPRDFMLKTNIRDQLFFDLSPTVIPAYSRLPDLAYFHWLPLLNPLRRENSEPKFSPRWVARRMFRLVWEKEVERFLKSRRTINLANSHSTQQELKKVGLDCQVAYPPVDVASWYSSSESKRRGVVSVARFSPSLANKHHEWQLQIMEGKRTNLLALGGCSTPEESRHLDWLRHNAGANVTLAPNVSHQQIKDALWSSKVFLHTAEKEGFGMSVVEAIAAGCIPLVYDDGGPREIVITPELRFKSIEEARAKLDRALAGEYDSLLPRLRRHIQMFDVPSYKKRLLRILDRL